MQGSAVSYVRRHHVGLVALFVALGGTAVAAFDPIGSDGDVDACFDKKSGDLDVLKGKKCGKREKPVSWSVEGPPGPVGETGPAGSPDTPQQVLEKLTAVDGASSGLDADTLDGATSADLAGPRAYGRVAAGSATVTRSKGVAGASRPSPGTYCLDLPGLDPTSAPMVVTPDFSGTTTIEGAQTFAHVEWRSSGLGCPAGNYEVITFEYDGGDGSDDANDGDVMTLANQTFSFVVP